MNKIRTYTVTALLLICSFYGNVIKGRTQTYPFLRYPTQSLTIEDGMRQSVALDIAFDKYNFCWMSFMNGIQRYDGTRIVDIPVQSGLPTDVNIKFWVRENKDLYLLHSSGISHYNADKAIFNQVFKFEDTSVQHITLLHSNMDYLYIITDYTTIYIIDTKEFRVFSKKEIGQIKQVANNNPSFFSQCHLEL
ncbi:MAG: hypothetical protein KL787_04090 [Taibaiella sp.]|nr:hypothetical protein [Taibaiella sp.]